VRDGEAVSTVLRAARVPPADAVNDRKSWSFDLAGVAVVDAQGE
jgi:hypothetical protein